MSNATETAPETTPAVERVTVFEGASGLASAEAVERGEKEDIFKVVRAGKEYYVIAANGNAAIIAAARFRGDEAMRVNKKERAKKSDADKVIDKLDNLSAEEIAKIQAALAARFANANAS
jgi:hypothetical protein